MKLVPSVCALAVVAAGCNRAESQGGLTLEKKLPGAFAQVSNVVELDDGRVAFADTRAKLFLTADLATRVARIGGRVADASDADAGIARQQEGYDLGRLDWTQVDASGTPADTLVRARAALERT